MAQNRAERVKANLLKQVGLPTSPCPRHNVLKTRNGCGAQICKLCDKERAKERAQKRRESGILPTPCPKCTKPRIWDTFGRPKCPDCANEIVKDWQQKNADKIKVDRKEHYVENRDDILRKAKDYYQENRDVKKEKHSQYTNSHDREYWLWKGMHARCYNPNHAQYKDWGGRGIIVFEDWRRDPSLSKEENYPKYIAYKKYIDDVLGPQPSPKHSIDRIDNSGNYEPDNLRWASKEAQANNTRRNITTKEGISDDSPIYYSHYGLITLKQFAEIIGLPLIVAKYRYSQNMDAKHILDYDLDNRYYKYKEHMYNMAELCLISGIKYNALHTRINVYNWSVERAVETPSQKRS